MGTAQMLLIFGSFLVAVQLVASGDVTNGSMRLMFVHSIWRHGDRSPTETFPTDPFQEDAWTFGGGGWGQLSPVGMRQQMKLGEMLRDRYVDGRPYQFLSPNYNSKEIYVRSTDKNRTLISAFSNLLGMYGQANHNNRPDLDYPNVAGWPPGLIPIAIHTIDDSMDHLVDVDTGCPLQDAVWAVARQTPQISQYLNRPDVVGNLSYLSQVCGEKVDGDNLWIIFNSLMIEQIYYADELPKRNAWFSKGLFDSLSRINDQVQDFQNGNFDPVISNGMELSSTLKTIRAGTMLDDLLVRMEMKLKCAGQDTPSCKYTNGLKYFAYSAHDSTIYSLLSALGAQYAAIDPPGHYPLYAACLLIELWRDDASGRPFFKLIYHRDENDGLDYVITRGVRGCQSDFCDLSVFADIAANFKPPIDLNQWCYDGLPGTTSIPRQTSTQSARGETGALTSIASTLLLTYVTWNVGRI